MVPRTSYPRALLDAVLAIREHQGTIEGLRIAIVGDILFSRVAR
jgi:aspartate carbamoyltransferase catalytic subunit